MWKSLVVVILLRLARGEGIELNNGLFCDVPISIPKNVQIHGQANQQLKCYSGIHMNDGLMPHNMHMCFTVTISQAVLEYRNETTEVQVLTQPCPTCFPEVKTINKTHEVAVYTDVCSLKPLWRFPRRIRGTTSDVKIITTPGFLRKRRYPHRVLCIWNVACSEQQNIYFNATQHNTQSHSSQDEQQLCPDYIQVKLGNSSLESCGSVPHEMLVNQVQDNELQLMFRSDTEISDDGLRLDTTCFSPTETLGTVAGTQDDNEDCVRIGDHANTQMVPNEAEQEIVRQIFQLHFELFSVTDACSRGVDHCVQTDFHHLATSINETLGVITQYAEACNPIVKHLVYRTLELLK